MHTFYAEEDSCFFDIMLPNYTGDHNRCITYFNELKEENCLQEPHCNGKDIAHDLFSHDKFGLTKLIYDTTPDLAMPTGMEVTPVEYRGDFLELQKYM